MYTIIDSLRSFLYNTLGLERYLRLLQILFIFSYNTGLLKWNSKYRWHYFVKNIVQPTDNIIDIGANLGYFSFIFSQIIKHEGELCSVEPVKPYKDLLEKLLPCQQNITVFSFALGNKNEGPIKLGMPPFLQNLKYLRHGRVAVLNDDEIKSNRFLFESDIKKGSEVFGNLAKLDYIKCDIEGYETVVLLEMKPVLQQHKPLVQLETWDEQLPIMLSFFEELGYSAFHLEKNILINCKELSLVQIASSDILFVPLERFEIVKKFIKV